MQIFARSWKGLNLSPGERAFVKLAEGWLVTAIATGIAIAYQMLATGSHDYKQILTAAGGAAGLTLLLSLKKYNAAQSDLPLPVASLATQAVDLGIAKLQEVAPQAQQAAQSVQVPQVQFTAPTSVTQAPQFVQTAPQPFAFAPSTTYPNLPVAPQQ